MKRDDVHDLMLGAVLVVLGYALYKHFNPTSATTAPAAQTPMGIAVGEVASNATTSGPKSPYTSLQDLLAGAVHDIGGFGGTNYLAMLEGPTINPW
jgi:hypothetical protein